MRSFLPARADCAGSKLIGCQSPDRKRVDLLVHQTAQCFVNQAVPGERVHSGKARCDDHHAEMAATATGALVARMLRGIVAQFEGYGR